MPSQPTLAEPAPAQSDAERYRDILRAIVEIGLRHLQATDPATTHASGATTPQPGPAHASTETPAATYDRLSRSVRRSIMLADHLATPASTPAIPSLAPTQRTAARREVIRAVENTIQRCVREPHRDSFEAELADRLDSAEFEHEIATRPPADIIKEICQDLNIGGLPGTHPWKRRTPDDIAALHAWAAAPPPAPLGAAAPASSPLGAAAPPSASGAAARPRTNPSRVPPRYAAWRPDEPGADSLTDNMHLALALAGHPTPVHDPP